MQKYCDLVKNKLNMLIRGMEKNALDFAADPKRDFIRKSELSFSKTMKFILGMGSQTLNKALMDFYSYDSKMVSVSAIVQMNINERQSPRKGASASFCVCTLLLRIADSSKNRLWLIQRHQSIRVLCDP